jgi:hypothetical protein
MFGIGTIVALMSTLNLDQYDTTDFDGNPSTATWLPTQARVSVVGAFAVLSAALGVLSWLAGMRAKWIEEALEDTAYTLRDKNAFVRLVDELRGEAALPSEWTHDELIASIEGWAETGDWLVRTRPSLTHSIRTLLLPPRRAARVPLREFAVVTGPADFADLFMSSGLERNLISERLVRSGDRAEFRYQAIT